MSRRTGASASAGAGAGLEPSLGLRLNLGPALWAVPTAQALDKLDDGSWVSYRYGSHDDSPSIMPVKFRINLSACDFAKHREAIVAYLVKSDFDAFSSSSCAIIERFKLPGKALKGYWLERVDELFSDGALKLAVKQRFDENSEVTVYVDSKASLLAVGTFCKELQAFITSLGCNPADAFIADTYVSNNISMRFDGDSMDSYIEVTNLICDKTTMQLNEIAMHNSIWYKGLVRGCDLEEEWDSYSPINTCLWRLVYECSVAKSDTQRSVFLELGKLAHALHKHLELHEGKSADMEAALLAIRQRYKQIESNVRLSENILYGFNESFLLVEGALAERVELSGPA